MNFLKVIETFNTTLAQQNRKTETTVQDVCPQL